MFRQGLLLVLCGLPWGAAVASCATAPVAMPPSGQLMVHDGEGTLLWQGNASFTVRGAQAGASERAVGLPGMGEIHVGIGGDDGACRLVWSRDGLDKLVVYALQGRPCAERSPDRLCFAGARFLRPPADAVDAARASPAMVIVRGCADENDLLWGKIEGAAPATVGPRAWRQRCVKVKATKRSCPITYLKKQSLSIATHPSADEGFALVWDGEGWRACFLEAEAGAYDLKLLVEDACGAATALHLHGDSAELDD